MASAPTSGLADTPGLTVKATLPVFVVTIGLSAFLLFGVQPLFAKLVLPVLGGSPAVWSVATVVFQCLLLAGYAYAHALAALRIRTSLLIHLGLLAVAGACLPIGLPSGWLQAPAGFEVPWLAALTLSCIGLPFFAVAANGPLLQAWFARTGHRQARDPYFLYAASNIGSFAALAAYPFLIEPTIRLRDQAGAWSLGFAALAVLIAACGLTAGRGRAGLVEAAPEDGAVSAPTWHDRLVWIGVSAVPAGLLVGVTAHISTDVAPMPLLWIVPLGVYLVSFVVAFRPGRWLDDPLLTLPRIGLTLLALLGWLTSFEAGLALHLGLFAVTALVCHRMLFRARPDPRHLTGFYLALSVGGAIGGLLCGVVAPLVFNTLAEYPILLVAALACRSDLVGQKGRFGRDAGRAGAICAAMLLATICAVAWGCPPLLGLKALLITLSVIAIAGWRSVGTSLVAIGTIAIVQTWSVLPGGGPQESIRSFFGIHRILTSEDGNFRILSHGTTIHGAVRVREADGSLPRGRPEPTTYYTYEGAIGGAIASARSARGGALARVSAVGLGTGSLACHRQPGEDWSFYEIDAAVVRIARDASRFPFLAECGAGVPVVIGDARLTLTGAAPGQDLIVVDAFSSDSIPFHLLTREAIGLYLSRLGPEGVILMHVSNRHLDLSRILARTAAEHGLVAVEVVDSDRPEERRERMRTPAKIVLLARDVAHVGPIVNRSGATRLEADPARRPWTDDFSNVLEALRDARRPVEPARK